MIILMLNNAENITIHSFLKSVNGNYIFPIHNLLNLNYLNMSIKKY